MTCPACADALTNPLAGIVHADCRGCAVRSVSHAPEWAREAYYEKIRDATRRERFRLDVAAEEARRRAMQGTA